MLSPALRTTPTFFVFIPTEKKKKKTEEMSDFDTGNVAISLLMSVMTMCIVNPRNAVWQVDSHVSRDPANSKAALDR